MASSPQESQVAKVTSDLDKAYRDVFDEFWRGTKFDVSSLVEILNEAGAGTLTEEQSARFFEATDKELKRVSE